MGWGAMITQLNPGPRWRKHRRIIKEKFSPSSTDEYMGIQKGVVYNFLAGLGKTPEDFRKHIKR